MGIRGILRRKASKDIKKDLKVQEKQNIEIRDSLAMERTRLANERTLLAYSRTGMALVLAGLSFIKFFEDPIYKLLGAMFIPMGIAIGVFGYRRFSRKQQQIAGYAQAYTPTSQAHAQVATQEKAAPESNSTAP